MAGKTTPFNMERFFQALGDNTRLRLLNLMGDQEICVCYFVEILSQGQPKISRHLAYLRRAGIVAARREGKWMHYRIVMPQNRRRCTGAASDSGVAQRRSGHAGGPSAAGKGLLQPGKVRRSSKRARTCSGRFPIRN